MSDEIMSEDEALPNDHLSNESPSNMAQQSCPAKQINFNPLGQPILEGSEKFSTFVGRVAKTHCSPTYVTWKKVPKNIKKQIWKSIIVEYDVPSIYKKSVLRIANTAWKSWKYELRRHYDKFPTDGERKRNFPKSIKKEDWVNFIDMCSTEEDRVRREKGKSSRQMMKRPHTTGRTGLARTAERLKKEDGTATIARTRIYMVGHTSKNGSYPPAMAEQMVEIQRLIDVNPDLEQDDLDHDPVAMVCGRDGRGRVLGLGGGVSKTAYQVSAPSREIAQRAQHASESMRKELDTLKSEHQSLREQVTTLMETRRSTWESSESRNSQEMRHSVESSMDSPSVCLVKNLRQKVVAAGRVNRDATSAETYNIILDGIYEVNENLYDRDEKFGDIRVGDIINWPKSFVEFLRV